MILDLNWGDGYTWQPIHHEIGRIATASTLNVTANITYNDVFNYFQAFEDRNPTIEYNVLFLQYVLSDMIAHGYDPNVFFDNLISKIIRNMPAGSVIVINDINLNTGGRDYFWSFVYKLYGERINASPQSFHFVNNNNCNYVRFGDQHPNNALLTVPPPAIQSQYNPWMFCSSAQIAITKES